MYWFYFKGLNKEDARTVLIKSFFKTFQMNKDSLMIRQNILIAPH
jgi:hypothetical protein